MTDTGLITIPKRKSSRCRKEFIHDYYINHEIVSDLKRIQTKLMEISVVKMDHGRENHQHRTYSIYGENTNHQKFTIYLDSLSPLDKRLIKRLDTLHIEAPQIDGLWIKGVFMENARIKNDFIQTNNISNIFIDDKPICPKRRKNL